MEFAMLLKYVGLVCASFAFFLAAVANAEDWPMWRGPRGDGTSGETDVPTRWDGESGKNVIWRTPLPGSGYASPIVLGDRIFTVACDQEKLERQLLQFDAKSGETAWRKKVVNAPLEKKHLLNSYASSTPASNGELVFAAFLEADFGAKKLTGGWKEATPGNMVVAAYDFAGDRRWLVRPGRFSSVHGFCSSPVLFEDLLIVNGDHDGDSYIVALKQATGETVWKTPRKNKTRSYCVPIIREIDGRTQMILSGDKTVTSYDPRNGKLHWIIQGPTEQFVASLVYNGELLFLTAGFPERHMMAIRPDGHGDVTATHILWRTTKGCSYVPSPIAADKYFLVVSDTGIGSCFEAKTGERVWTRRMGRHYSTSMVSAAGLVYFLSDDGEVTVVRPGDEYDEVARNLLGEKCFASPAISNGRIYLRSVEHLWCIGEE
jgi:outer membrane protein assembly factor BamB